MRRQSNFQSYTDRRWRPASRRPRTTWLPSFLGRCPLSGLFLVCSEMACVAALSCKFCW